MIIFLWLAVILAGVYILVSICTTWLQEWFIFRPERLKADYTFEFQKKLEEVWVDSPRTGGSRHADKQKDGKIHALWRKVPDSKGVVLYYHGNAGSLKRWGHLYNFFERHGYDLFIIDYRGYGKSKGKKSSDAMYADAEVVYDFVRKHYAPEKILIYGRSLGSAFALHVGAKFPARALVLETPFSSMEDLFYAYFPFLPRIFPFHFRFENRQNLEKVPYPVYLFHGTDDWVVPYRVASRLIPYLKDSDRFFTVIGGNHNDLLYFDLYQEEMDWILK
ncbi:MAG: alpha/beta hydrolase [Bacteroidetes bacterium]|nr:alpha/beta hydrolase [Bacteroidota bacterium]